MSNPLVSVIIPVYKAEGYLHYAVDSVLSQTYFNLELVLIDDGSPDRSGEICDAYARKDDRVHVIHKKNGGVSDARNTGLRFAQGDYLLFVDNDDCLCSITIERMVSAAQNENADIVCADRKVFNDYQEIGRIQHDASTMDRGVAYTAESAAANSFLRTTVWAKLYRSDVGKAAWFPTGHYAEDIYYNALVLADERVKTVYYLQEPLYYYRDNPLSASHNWDVQHFVDIEKTVLQLFSELNHRRINQSILTSYLLLFFSQFCSAKYNIIIRDRYVREIRLDFQKDRKALLPALWRSQTSVLNKISYYLLSGCNIFYRLYVFYTDPTMKAYERNVRSRLTAL